MSSKAQGLSLNTIIIAAIVLIVLLLLVGLLTGFFGKKFGPDFGRLSDTSCKGNVISDKGTCATGEREDYTADVPQGTKCCIKVCEGQCIASCRDWETSLGQSGCPEGRTCCKAR